MIKRDPASYTDPHGYVFWEGEQVFRRVYPQAADFMRALVTQNKLGALTSDGRLVGASIHADDAAGLVLAHPRVAPASYPEEWPAAMLKDAATLVLEVAAEASAMGLSLADGHPWNVFYDGPRPRFLDWGSIAPASSTLLWPAQSQFNRFMLYPLHLYAAGHSELARARLADLALGVTPDLALRSLSSAYRFGHPKLALGLIANRVAERFTADPKAPTSPQTQAKAPDPVVLEKLRPGYFRGLQRDVASVGLPAPKGGWAAYYASCPSMASSEEERKLSLVEQVLKAHRPASVLDLGANTGRFSLLAAQAGARVTAIDQDDASMAELYRKARESGLAVLPLVMDLGRPTPAGGWCAEQRPDALTRLSSDCVLMLALMHHLVFTGNHSLEQVARLARRSTRDLALIEWVGADDPMALFLRRTATKDFSFYTPEALMAALAAEGFDVTPLEAHASARQLLLCRLRK